MSILTCVYCGTAYPEGTPPHGAQILTDHIKVCEKHPMREAERKITLLWNALADLIGAETEEELAQMEMSIRVALVAKQDKATALNGIHALLQTMPK